MRERIKLKKRLNERDGVRGEHIPANSVTVRSVCQPVKPVTEAAGQAGKTAKARPKSMSILG